MKCPQCKSDNTDTARFCSNCATSLTSADDAQPSFTKTLETPVEDLARGILFANRYKIIEELGRGGMGKVYKVLDTQINEDLALKILKPEIAADEMMIERFRNELKIARKISHKHICRTHDINEEDGKPYITMEYVKGDDLKSLIREHKILPPKKAISIAMQICEGLAAAHELGIVHRDLKPQNIMIDENDQAKIMDFGIARTVEAGGMTQTGVMIGTPDYMSPEQAEGEVADHRSDIYALGIILFEMVTGTVPFRGDTALSVALKHKLKLPQDPKKLNPDISDDLSRLILICMEKDRERRYQTTDEVLRDLHKIEEGLPLGTKVPSRRQTFNQKLIRGKLFAPSIVIFLAIIALVIWQIIIQKNPAPVPLDKPSIAVLPFDDLSPLEDQEVQCEGMAETLAAALSQINNLYVPARTSAFSFREKEKDYQEIGEKLNVKTVLEGSFQKAGNQLRIAARIIDTSDGSLLWAETYDGEEKDIFDIQDQIILEAVDNLKIILQGEEKTQLTKRRTENLEAYNLYIQGQFLLRKRTSEGFYKALEFFEKAVKIEANFALAYVGMAESYLLIGAFGLLAPQETFPISEKYALQALAIDKTIGEAYTTLAFVQANYDWDWDKAEKNYRKAIELNPSYAIAHHWYARLLNQSGRYDEAIREGQRAEELDPVQMQVKNSVIEAYYLQEEYDRALEECLKVKEFDPSHGSTLKILGLIYAKKKMYNESIVELENLSSIYPDMIEFRAPLGYVYAIVGRTDDALSIIIDLKSLSMKRYVSPYNIAMIYAGLKDNDKALENLWQAYREKDYYLKDLKVDPTLDNIRSDSRYKDLLKKMNLE